MTDIRPGDTVECITPDNTDLIPLGSRWICTAVWNSEWVAHDNDGRLCLEPVLQILGNPYRNTDMGDLCSCGFRRVEPLVQATKIKQKENA